MPLPRRPSFIKENKSKKGKNIIKPTLAESESICNIPYPEPLISAKKGKEVNLLIPFSKPNFLVIKIIKHSFIIFLLFTFTLL